MNVSSSEFCHSLIADHSLSSIATERLKPYCLFQNHSWCYYLKKSKDNCKDFMTTSKMPCSSNICISMYQQKQLFVHVNLSSNLLAIINFLRINSFLLKPIDFRNIQHINQTFCSNTFTNIRIKTISI